MTEPERARLLKPNERIDDLQRNRLKIIQNPTMFSFGIDAVLLSGFAWARRGDRILDLGTGTGILPLLMSAKTPAEHFTALEILPEYADMARRSVLLNGLQEKIKIIEGDIREADVLFAPASFDVVTANPPYLPAGSGPVNPGSSRAAARHEILCSFADVAAAAESALRTGGRFFLVHRSQRLAEVMTQLRMHRLEPKRMRLVYSCADRESELVLLECVLGGHEGLTVQKPLILFCEKGVYTDEVKRLYGF